MKEKFSFAVAALISSGAPTNAKVDLRHQETVHSSESDSEGVGFYFGGTTTKEDIVFDRSSQNTIEAISSGIPAEISVEWNVGFARRFKSLAIKESLGSITPEEFRELAQLDNLRERSGFPPSAEEVIHNYRQRRVTEELKQSLRNYVEFFKTSEITHSPGRKT